MTLLPSVAQKPCSLSLPRYTSANTRVKAAALAVLAGLAGAAQAQPGGAARDAAAAPPAVLSSPLPAGAGGTAPLGVPSGSGAGFHSPNSPIAPLPDRSDVVPWSVLTDLTKKTTKDGIVPVFNDAQKGMDKTVQRIQGFMMPLNARATQTHFLLTSVPLTCSFCMPGGPESMVEVKAKTPVRYSTEPVVVEGKFTVLTNDQYGLFYRVVDAVPVK
ncbi:DUF3299 domain-containing protein [Acidovorax sp. RAC01]|uniref:DUF3299 domain-containing protein n=1 Tax=Acidovorax sp. RAC01 TaxID=1842533 RepID=UPI000858FD19|nr:DUF3299 domain-containing protein [Acidovorax sp. RAC01]AOG22453.1 hypothetical protein BSY15_3575 [Acidovorax sp. RAC01]